MTARFSFLLFVGSGAMIGLLIWLAKLVWGAQTDGQIVAVGAKINFVGLLGAFVASIVAIVGAYYTFFTPFDPRMTVGSYSWRIRPQGSPNLSVEVVLWVSTENRGVTPGQLTDMVAVLSLPKGDWVLQPLFFLDSSAYMRRLDSPQDTPGFDATEPFAPIFISGRGQASRVVLFGPFHGKANFEFLEPGVFQMRFFARINNGRYVKLAERKIVFEVDMIQKWRSGTTISGAQFEDDRPVEDLLKESGVDLR